MHQVWDIAALAAPYHAVIIGTENNSCGPHRPKRTTFACGQDHQRSTWLAHAPPQIHRPTTPRSLCRLADKAPRIRTVLPFAMPAITKRCHWVPQAYLRHFSADPQRQKIWRLSKHDDGGDPELKPIDKVPVRFHLYSPKDSNTGQRDDTMERKLSSLERFLGDRMWYELSHGQVDLFWEPLRKMVALMVAVMQFRNPIHFELHKAMRQRLIDAILAEGALPSFFQYKDRTFEVDAESWPAFLHAAEDDIKRAWLDDLGSCTWYAQELMAMRWAILLADQPTFITSDNPVTLIHPSLRFRGLSDPETMVSFPLSPTRILCMDHRHGEPANVYYPLQGNGAAQNLLTWRGAIDHMFTSRHPDDVCRDLVEEEERSMAGDK